MRWLRADDGSDFGNKQRLLLRTSESPTNALRALQSLTEVSHSLLVVHRQKLVTVVKCSKEIHQVASVHADVLVGDLISLNSRTLLRHLITTREIWRTKIDFLKFAPTVVKSKFAKTFPLF